MRPSPSSGLFYRQLLKLKRGFAREGRFGSRLRVPTAPPERQKYLSFQTKSPRRSELAFRAKTCLSETRIIRGHVLSEHIDAVVVAAKIAAAHHALGRFLRLATAFEPTATVDSKLPDRRF